MHNPVNRAWALEANVLGRPTLQRKFHLCILFFWELRGLSPNFHIHVSVTDLYIPRIGPHISCSRMGRSMVVIYKLLTDTWMWKLGLWPSNSFSGNICFEFRYWFFAVYSRSVMLYDLHFCKGSATGAKLYWTKRFRWTLVNKTRSAEFRAGPPVYVAWRAGTATLLSGLSLSKVNV